MTLRQTEFYAPLWSACNALRAEFDAALYKNYLMTLLFLKVVSDKYIGLPQTTAPIYVPAAASFADLAADATTLTASPGIGEATNKLIASLVKHNPCLKGLEFPDFTISQLSETALTSLIRIFAGLDFKGQRALDADILNDLLATILTGCAGESSKNKAPFYTPPEVSRLLARLLVPDSANLPHSATFYDPACGSAALLLTVVGEASPKISIEAQEKDPGTAFFARLNMILHGYIDANIACGNTLAQPAFKDGRQLRTYDFVVAHPPFADRSWRSGLDPASDPYQRFAWGEPPAHQGDHAWLLHVIRTLDAEHGKGACILPQSVLQRGNGEAVIRKALVDSGILKAIIALPHNLFYGSATAAVVLILDKENASERQAIMMIDATHDYVKDGSKNRLPESSIRRIADTFWQQREEPCRSRRVPIAEISDEKNDYSLNLCRYIDASDAEDLQDINAHLNGGIPDHDIDQLAAYWTAMPQLRAVIFKPLRKGYNRLKLATSELHTVIAAHHEYQKLQQTVFAVFAEWQSAMSAAIKDNGKDGRPAKLIENLSDNLLASLSALGSLQLIDPYRVCQHLYDAWHSTIADDAYQIAFDGWQVAPERISETDRRGRVKERGWNCALIPKQYIVARYFKEQHEALSQKESEVERLAAALDAFEEEYDVEDGAFAGLEKLNQASVKACLVELADEADSADERQVLNRWLELSSQLAERRKVVKEMDEALDQAAYDHYARLSSKDIQTMIVDDKWFALLSDALQRDLDAIARTLADRITQLAERYAASLHQLNGDLAAASRKVDLHLRRVADKDRPSVSLKKWEVKRLGELMSFHQGRNPAEAVGKDGTVPVIGPAGQLGTTSTALYDKASVLIGHKGTINKPQYIEQPFWPVDTLFYSMINSNNNARFLYYRLLLIDWQQYNEAPVVPTLNARTIENIEIDCPQSGEQNAIAAMLSDIDDEIAALEARLSKSKALKQGMMQELLTGRKRLI